jgi:hypothetical protein
MKESPTTPLRGDAAFRAQKAELVKRNNAACAEAAAHREQVEARAAARLLASERLEASNLPKQPRP